MDLNKLKLLVSPLTAQLPKIIAVAGIVALAYLFGTCSRPSSDYQTKLKAWQTEKATILAQNEQTKNEVKTLLAKNDSLATKASKQTTQITTLQLSANKLRKATDSIYATALRSTELCNSLCRLYAISSTGYKADADTLQHEVDSLQARDTTRLVTIANLQLGIKKVQTQNDSLVKLVNIVPVYKEGKFLGLFPKPSRTVSLVLGLVVGGVIGYEVKKEIDVNTQKR